jgi:hypothetical protein
LKCLISSIVTSSWAYHNESKQTTADRDFMKLNKKGIKNKVVDAKVRLTN